ncbi:rRNA methyltransferase 2 mitochondrial, partial [Dissostichus eleginoides]
AVLEGCQLKRAMTICGGVYVIRVRVAVNRGNRSVWWSSDRKSVLTPRGHRLGAEW